MFFGCPLGSLSTEFCSLYNNIVINSIFITFFFVIISSSLNLCLCLSLCLALAGPLKQLDSWRMLSKYTPWWLWWLMLYTLCRMLKKYFKDCFKIQLKLNSGRQHESSPFLVERLTEREVDQDKETSPAVSSQGKMHQAAVCSVCLFLYHNRNTRLQVKRTRTRTR